MNIKNKKGNIIALSTALSLIIVSLVIYFTAFTTSPPQPSVDFANVEEGVIHLKKYR